MTRTWDAIVVGGRVAGAATALLLARRGLDVLCVDRSREGSDTLSTHALMRGGVLQLQQWGLLEPLREAGTPAVRRTVFHYGADTVEVSIKRAAGVDALYAPRRTVLDVLLVEAARRAGATFHFSAPVVDVVRGSDGTISRVRVQDRRRGSSRVERAGLVIGADGRESVVAGAVKAGMQAIGEHAGSYLYGYWMNLPSDGYEWFYAPGVAGGTIPTNDGLTCAFVGADASLMRAVSRKSTAAQSFARVAQVAGFGDRLAAAVQVEPIRRASMMPPSYLRTAYGPGWALVGDAGHWLDPIGTHGMTGALRDAELLSAAIGTGATASSFATYQAERDRLSMPMLELADRIASYAWDMRQIRWLLRGLASAMADEVEALSAIAAAA